MSVVLCRACGMRIGGVARFCPHCGVPQSRRSAGKVFRWLLLVFQCVMFVLLVLALRGLPDAVYAVRSWAELAAVIGRAGMGLVVGTTVWLVGALLLALLAFMTREKRRV